MTIKDENTLRREIVEIGRRVYERFLVAANDGNISARLDGETALVTPTGVSKGFMSVEDIIKVSLGGRKNNPQARRVSRRKLVTEKDVLAAPPDGQLFVPQEALVTPLARQIALERRVTLTKAGMTPPAAGERRPSSETPMHLAIYRARPDVNAIVHTHAPSITAFALTDAPLDESLMPEVLASIGQVALVPYASPGTEELPQAMTSYLVDHDAFLLANHGAVTVGSSLEEAYFRMERLELFARIRLAAQALGTEKRLPPQEVERLLALHEKSRDAS